MSWHERSNDLPTWQQVPAHTVLRSAPPGPLVTCFHTALCPRRPNCRDYIHELSCLSFVLHLGWEMRSRILEGEKGDHDKYSLGLPCVVALSQLSLTLPVIRSPPESPARSGDHSSLFLHQAQRCQWRPAVTSPFPVASLRATHTIVNSPAITNKHVPQITFEHVICFLAGFWLIQHLIY